jgi:hypothetical protein
VRSCTKYFDFVRLHKEKLIRGEPGNSLQKKQSRGKVLFLLRTGSR